MNSHLIALVMLTLPSLGYSQTTTNYMDRNGSVTGSAVTYSNGTTQYRDVNGSVVGSSYNGDNSSNTTVYRDSNGSAIGSTYSSSPSVYTAPPIRPLNQGAWQAR